jgi:hypothetical protein
VRNVFDLDDGHAPLSVSVRPDVPNRV